MIQFDEHNFEMGWNHQLVLVSGRAGDLFRVSQWHLEPSVPGHVRGAEEKMWFGAGARDLGQVDGGLLTVMWLKKRKSESWD